MSKPFRYSSRLPWRSPSFIDLARPSSVSAGRRIPCSSASASTDRKSTRLNSSHLVISYAVFCLKKKKKDENNTHQHDDCHTDTQHECAYKFYCLLSSVH